MAVYYSTRVRDLIMGKPITVTDAGSQISFVSGTSRIETTQNDFLTQGFRPGQKITVTNANVAANNDDFTIDQVGAGYIQTVEALQDEAAGAGTPTITVANGLNLPLIFKNGIFVIYSQPIMSDPDLAPTGNKLAELTESGGAFTAGVSTNGLNVEFSADGVFQIKSGETWEDLTPVLAGTAYYGILYDNGYIEGDDSTNKVSPRIMGTVGLSGSGRDFIITSTGIETTIPVFCTKFQGTASEQACS